MSALTRALHQGYGDVSTTNAYGLGRFLSVDPILGTADRPQSWNRYSYVENNPIGAIDPTGMKMECVSKDDGTEECTVISDDPLPDPFPIPAKARAPDWVITVQAVLKPGDEADMRRNEADQYWRVLWGANPFKNAVMPVGIGVTSPLLGTSRINLLQNITNPKLRGLIERLYRPNASVGTGSTADAIRYEMQTGIMLSKAGHFQKGMEMRTALIRVLRTESLSAAERQAVRAVLIDLQKALSGL
jgi:filamentous hemagglutinin